MKLPSRKFFLSIIISSLAVTAILGIIAITTSTLGEVGTKVLVTTIVLDFACVLGLCCAGKPSSKLHHITQSVGFTSTALAFVLALFIIWNESLLQVEGLWRSMMVMGTFAIVAAHSSLILPTMAFNRILRIVTLLTVACIILVGELVANYFLFADFNPDESYTKAIGVVLILDVLGTILIPLLKKFGPPADKPAVATS